MNFFEHQDHARRNTRRLVVLFLLSVASIVGAVYLAALLAFGYLEHQAGEPVSPWSGRLFAWVAVATVGMIAAGSLYKVAALSGGGAAVATSLGGRPVDPHTADPAQRRLLNVVEEMAIASGLPVPTVYLLGEEDALNAFAAGLTPGDAVVAVTRGCLDRLSRDELQGVVAHELSHIAWGDMRLNLRLMGLLHGILLLGLTGEMILRFGPRRGGGRRDRGGGSILLFGLALLVIGYVGVFFGRLIKSGISRQREFLADAAAVQFTRNPTGLAGALAKIATTERGSRLEARRSEEASHLFFANGVREGLTGWLSTHPPVLERIRRLDPRTAAEVEVGRWRAAPPAVKAAAAPARLAPPETVAAPPLPVAAGGLLALDAEGWIAGMGSPTAEHLAYSAALLQGLAPRLTEAAHDTAGARALVWALLLDRAPGIRERQLGGLAGAVVTVEGPDAGRALLRCTQELSAEVDAAPAAARLPLVDLAMPALRRLSPDRYRSFREQVRRLVETDGRWSLFELALERALLRHLDQHFEAAPEREVRYRSVLRLGPALSLLFSALARVGGGGPEGAARAFQAAAARLAGTGASLEPTVAGEVDAKAVGEALDTLAEVPPRLKQRLLEAAAAAVLTDRKVTVEEAELLRAVADALEAPAPPLLPMGSLQCPETNAGAAPSTSA